MQPVLGVVAVVAGLAALGYAVYARTERPRSSHPWLRSAQAGDERTVGYQLVAVPGAGFLLVGFGLTRFGPDGWWVPLVPVLVVPGVVLVLMAAFLPRPPLWLYPGWSRDEVRGRRGMGGTGEDRTSERRGGRS